MQKNNNKNKLIFILLFLLILIFIILVFINELENHEASHKAIEEYGYETMGAYNYTKFTEESEKSINYKNISVLQTLRGELPVGTITKQIKLVFVTNIPDVLQKTKKMSNEELSNYYFDNVTLIENNLRINSESSFLNMISKFRKLTSDLTEDYQSCEFLKDDNLKLIFSYDNGESIECYIIGEKADEIIFEF